MWSAATWQNESGLAEVFLLSLLLPSLAVRDLCQHRNIERKKERDDVKKK